jgi:hypothetical protein
MSATEKKLAELNAIYAIIREWQSGSISQSQMKGRLGKDYLTTEQIDALLPRLYRTIDKADLAKVLADVVGL